MSSAGAGNGSERVRPFLVRSGGSVTTPVSKSTSLHLSAPGWQVLGLVFHDMEYKVQPDLAQREKEGGFMKAVVDGATGQILGAAVLGLEGGEVMSLLQLAMMGKLPYTALYNSVFAHPNLSEALNNLFLESNFVS